MNNPFNLLRRLIYQGIILGFGLVGAIFLGVLFFNQGYGYSAVRLGSWVGWPDGGMKDTNPFAATAQWLSGSLAVGGSEGLSFVAERDQSGRPLDAGCDYTLSGARFYAQWWSVSVERRQGETFIVPTERVGLTTGDVLRRQDSSFDMTLSAFEAPGNWLPLGREGSFRIVIRLYDADYKRYQSKRNVTLPLIIRGQCR